MRSTSDVFSGDSRKEKRKKKKILKKCSKVAFASHKKLEEVVKEKFGSDKKKKKRKRSKKKKSKDANPDSAVQVEQDNSLKKFNSEAEKLRRQRLRDQVKEDNAEIRKMEKLLGYKKHKSNNLPKIFYAEGLDYLLEMCDKEKRVKLAEKDEKEEENDEDSLMNETNESEDELSHGSAVLDESDAEDMEQDDYELDEDLHESESGSESNVSSKDEPEITEDIYGRKVDAKTGKIIESLNISGAKAKLESLEGSKEYQEKRQQLEKAIRGVINRLNESTLSNSIKTISDIFSSNSHNEVKQIYSDVIFKAVATNFALPERLLLTYGTFLALTHVTVSSEITSHLVEHHTTKFFDLMQNGISDEKPITNLVVLLAHLYNLKVVKTTFIIELITFLSRDRSEKALSMILSIITFAGTSLKKRDAKQLQDTILSVQQAFVDMKGAEDTSARMNFLIEDLEEIKNNHLKRLTSKFDHTLLDHFYKLIKALSKNVQNKESELPFGVEDVLKVNERGRWWVVGSAWKPSDDGQLTETKDSAKNAFSPELLALAKKAKMNTELRRNLFCTILSSESEDDAFQRLQKFSLKGPQEREIIHICIMSALFEKEYNSFYASLIDRFCTYHKRFQLTTQYALWDRVKEISSLKPRQQANLAYAIADLIKLKSVGVTVLKIVNFVALDEPSELLMKRVMYRLCTRCSDSMLTEIFRKSLVSPKNELLAHGLQLFFEVSMKEEEFKEMDEYSLFKKRLSHVKNLCAIV